MQNHEIDYKIFGEEMQVVEIELDPQETAIAEAGNFMMMEDGINMETIFGDGSQQSGGGIMNKLFSAGKTFIGGRKSFYDSLYQYGSWEKESTFCSSLPW
jgi:uncharacterized protein (AIM24 family)